MGIKYLGAGVLVAVGLAVVVGAVVCESLRTFSEIPASLWVAAGLVPLMLIGQLGTTRKRSGR